MLRLDTWIGDDGKFVCKVSGNEELAKYSMKVMKENLYMAKDMGCMKEQCIRCIQELVLCHFPEYSLQPPIVSPNTVVFHQTSGHCEVAARAIQDRGIQKKLHANKKRKVLAPSMLRESSLDADRVCDSWLTFF